MTRPLGILLLFLAALHSALSQSAPSPTPSLPTDPRALLTAAAPFYDFSSPTQKPWHMKVSYQFYDLKGKPAEQGVWDHWWAAPKVHRNTWTRPGVERSEWSTAEGTHYLKESGAPLRYFERSISALFLSPLPARQVLESDRMKLDLKMVPPNKPALACVLTTLQWLVNGKLQSPPSGRPTYYCFDPPTNALRVTSSEQLTHQFDRIVITQGHYLARQVTIAVGTRKLFTASVDLIQAVDPKDPLFTPPADAILPQPAPPVDGHNDIAVGELVQKTQPVYPVLSKMAREQGTVVLAAVIGVDGTIHNLEVLTTPSSALAGAALDAVKQWKYKPYLLNGVPVEVETTINVIFTIGD